MVYEAQRVKEGTKQKMNVNILADFQENGQDKNEPHIVCGVSDEMIAGTIIKKKLEDQGCRVQSLTVIDGIWTLEQLHDMANYGDYLDRVNYRIIYLSSEMVEHLQKVRNNPKEAEKIRMELNDRIKKRRSNKR